MINKRYLYLRLLNELKTLRTVPSLAFYKKDSALYNAASDYVVAVEDNFKQLKEGQSLASVDNQTLLIGCVIKNSDERTIEMSPLHPLNVLYQLKLLDESQVGEVRENLVEKLTALYLLPFVKDSDKNLYHAIEQKHSPEWRYYAPASNRRYLGARNFVQKLVCDKINQYKEHFSFLFDDIGNRLLCVNLINMGDCRDFISYVENKAAEESTEIVYDISDQSFYQLTSLLGNGLMNAQGNMLQNMATCQKGIAKIDEIDSYLSVDIDEKVLSKIYKKIKTLEQEIIEHEASLEIAQKQRTGLNGDVMRATSEYNRFVENMLSNLESDDDNGRILKYAHHATQALTEYKIRLQKKKIGTLAETMTKCYKQLANKKNLISRIDMDAVTLDFVYLNADNQMVPKESLSAGEKQLMVISLLWALAICSKKKLPVIIDTPLSRMDSVHRVALIKTYFPNASDQTIILSTDSEIDKHYYEIMKDTVGDEFTLVYDDELKCSKIKKGYFLGD